MQIEAFASDISVVLGYGAGYTSLVYRMEPLQDALLLQRKCVCSHIGNESVQKIIINNTINLFLNCNQHFANFKSQQFPSAAW